MLKSTKYPRNHMKFWKLGAPDIKCKLNEIKKNDCILFKTHGWASTYFYRNEDKRGGKRDQERPIINISKKLDVGLRNNELRG